MMLLSPGGMPISPNCLICNAPLTRHQVRHKRLCGHNECAWQYLRLQQQNKLCRICQRPLTNQHWAAGICANPDCQRSAIAQRCQQDNQRLAARQKQLWQQATQLRSKVLQRFGIRRVTSFPVAIIPAIAPRITRLSTKQRRAFRQHLSVLIAQAQIRPPLAAPVVEEDAVSAQLQAASGNACACCRGSCCLGGMYTHAYLGVETLQRYMAEHPRQSAPTVLRRYMQHIGAWTCESSCVYHGPQGCTLPRTMRADICNRFYCKGLLTFHATATNPATVRGFFVAAADQVIERAAIVDNEQMLLLPSIPSAVD